MGGISIENKYMDYTKIHEKNKEKPHGSPYFANIEIAFPNRRLIKMQKSARQSNFELLRIISMMAIVVGHLFGEGHVTSHVPPSVWLPSLFLAGGARLAVGIFLMIGCWFLVDAPRFRTDRWIRIHATVLFYAVALTIASAAIWGGVETETVVRAFLPVLGRPLWYAAAWLTLLPIAPILHSAAFSVTRRDLGIASAALFAVISIPATFAGTLANDYFAALLWFVFVYLFVAWIKRGSGNTFANIPRFAALAVGIAFFAVPVFVEWGVLLSCGPCANPPAAYKIASRILADFKTIPLFLSSVGIFIFFAKTDIGSCRWINAVARPAFAVYVVHQTPAFWPHLWNDIIGCGNWYSFVAAPAIGAMSAVAVYLIVAVVDFARIAVMKRLWRGSWRCN